MSGPEMDLGTRSDTSRAVAFSDAIFAIIITLLVLDLRVPDVPPGRLLSGLLHQWPSYVAYLASYSYVAVVWLNHKAAFNRIQQADRGLHWRNLFVLFTTALLPFPTIVVSHALQEHDNADQRVAIAFYALIGALLCATWLAFYHYLARHPDLLKEQVKDAFFRVERLRALAGVVLYVLAGVVGYLVAPLVGLAIFLLLPVFYAVTSAGLYQFPMTRRITHRPPPPSG
ncbi:TMEM175 family protein [Micromonospora halotolerans]|uniref:TMEM175 family protein n=1 Tax=Micromonospora halotolerans TaxID=709879 RepID=A0ABY9ZWH7_9ACTN|nr:TMEM175 family protein [Micromonospora halotolerans]WNM39252.1 TMEM175 family protein [Micromonospora halotolerans]